MTIDHASLQSRDGARRVFAGPDRGAGVRWEADELLKGGRIDPVSVERKMSDFVALYV